MGGNAFNNTLPDALFPRISPELYTQLKTDLATRLRKFYAVVGTPREAPEKLDYGDIDFVVHSPAEDLRLDAVCAALGARAMIPLEGNRMSHFAVPLESDAGDGSCDTSQAYLQVDVRVCGTPEEWHRVMFFNSYGDMGMILGTMARMHGLAFGSSGLKLAHPLPTAPACTFPLSSDMDEILSFLGLSMARWEEGFSSVKDIFAWLATSDLYSPSRLARTGTERMPNRELKNRDQRKMYQGFFDYAAASRQTSVASTRPWTDAAIDHFGKRDLHMVLMYIAERKAHAKSVLSGTLTMQWTGVSGLPVRTIMNETKRQLGGEDVLSVVSGIAVDTLQSDGIDPVHLRLKVWEDSVAGKTVDDMQSMVVQVKEELEAEGRLWQKSKKKGVGVGI